MSRIHGGAGADDLSGGGGHDHVFGEAGDDNGHGLNGDDVHEVEMENGQLPGADDGGHHGSGSGG